VAKEYNLDPTIGYAIAKTALHALTGSIINWINSGFNGNPAFVTDLKGFLLDIADAETSLFIEGTALEALCSPWKLDIKIALALPTGQFEREVRCTLSDIVANMDDFINGDFSQGGWAGWFELTTKPQNNPYGLYLMTSSELDQRIAGAQHLQQQQLNWGNGFLSYEKCEELPPGFVGPPRCEIVTPGTVIENQLEHVLGSGVRQLELADEFNEIVSALVSQLITQALGGFKGLRGANESINNELPLIEQFAIAGTSDVDLRNAKDIVLAEANKSIKEENDYLNVKQATLNTVTASRDLLLLNLYVCYSDKLEELESEDKTIAEQRMKDALDVWNSQIVPIRTSLDNDINTANQNIAILNLSLIENATTVAEVQYYMNELIKLRQSGSLNDVQDLFNAQQEQTTVTAQMSALNIETNKQIAECQAFPPPKKEVKIIIDDEYR
jgi:hypothetical protein